MSTLPAEPRCTACASFFFSSRRRHTRSLCDWSSDVCSSDLTLFSSHGEHGAGLGSLAINEDRACTTRGRVAANVCTGQMQIITYPVDEQHASIDVILVNRAVNGDANMMFAHIYSPPVARASAFRTARTQSVRTMARLYSEEPCISLASSLRR